MIKVGISGGDNQMAGELLRLLLLHPEVEIVAVYAPSLRGRALGSHHRGIVGETDLRFSDALDLEALDVLFITDPELPLPQSIPDELKLIMIQNSDSCSLPTQLKDVEFVPGVSEMFRKPLVREARAARILPSPSSVALIILFPLALHLLLNDSLSLGISLPCYKKEGVDKDLMKEELEGLLNKVQLSFSRINDIHIENSDLLRTVSVEMELDCSVSEEEIERIYSQTYDDHNFTFLMRSEPASTEVAGTQKCLLYISKPSDGKIRVKAIADSFLRGGAGDAIHAMNLLFGLYEKTGLSFPATMAFRHDEIKPEEI